MSTHESFSFLYIGMIPLPLSFPKSDGNKTPFMSSYTAGNTCSALRLYHFQHLPSWANSKISSYYFNSLSNNSKRLPFAVYIGKLFLPKIIFTLSSICGQRPYWANITYSKLSHIWELILDTVSFFKQKGMLSKSHSEVSPQLSSSDIY